MARILRTLRGTSSVKGFLEFLFRERTTELPAIDEYIMQRSLENQNFLSTKILSLLPVGAALATSISNGDRKCFFIMQNISIMA